MASSNEPASLHQGSPGAPHQETSVSQADAAPATVMEGSSRGFARRPSGKTDAPLPRLPLPSLKETCERYVTSIKAVVDPYQYKAALEAVEDMKRETGPKLQACLKARDDASKCVSWLEEYWDDAYLATREPIPINVNSFFAFKPNRKLSQVERAASLLHAAVEVCVKVRGGHYEPHYSSNKEPLCMSQMRRVFCASRIPGETRDSIVSYSTAPLTDNEIISKTVAKYESVSPTHCVVIVRNRFYRFEVLDEFGAVLPLGVIAAAIGDASGRATNDKNEPGAPVGLLTTMERGKWAAAYKELEALGNKAHLLTMQSAIMVVCLDSVGVTSPAEAARLFLHGTGTNRWFDRHNLIVASNGAAGINFEHSVVDAGVTLHVADYMVKTDAARAPFFDSKCPADATKAALEEMKWNIGPPQKASMTTTLKAAFAEFMVLIGSNETEAVDFDAFGKQTIVADFLRPELKVGPKAALAADAFVQIALQLTYYRLYGRNCATYQTAGTRTFQHGRTETVRSATSAALRFLEAASLPLLAASSGPPGQCQLLQDALVAHVDLMEKAKRGAGVDRHMLGLRKIALSNPQLPFPAMLNDPAFEVSGRWILSTAQFGSPWVPWFGFGPAARDGFGIGYAVLDNEIRFTITSKYNQLLPLCRMFGQFLEESLLLMRSICESAADALDGATRQPEPVFYVSPDDMSVYV